MSFNNKSSRDNSLDGRDCVDISTVIAEFPHNDEFPNQIPVKKLVETFESCAAAHRNNTATTAALSSSMGGEGTMKVYLRVRPTQSSESTIVVENEHSIITTAPECSKRALYTKMESRNYMFTRVFDTTASQLEVYEHSAAPLLKKFLAGDNCVLFAYGMTNAGKTHTVQGKARDPGILPRIVSAIFDLPEWKHTTSKREKDWELHASMLEIYQDNIYDLLGKRKEKLNIRDGSGKVEVAKLSYHALSSSQDAFKMMETAAAKRTKSSTYLNTGSSRSHAVYTLTLSRPSSDGKDTVCSQFQVVDLAGAERGNRTKATAAQQKEANNINTSLMQLWRCLQAVRRKNADLNGSMEVIPFRESKLTHLLMPILSRAGLGGVAMIACVNPQVDDYDETLSVLGNASIASKIREFADVGRVAAHTQAPGAVAAAAAVAAAEKEKAEQEKAQREKEKDDAKRETAAAARAGGVKRKRLESTISAAAASLTSTLNAAVGRETRSRKNSANTASTATATVSAKTSIESHAALEKKREAEREKERERERVSAAAAAASAAVEKERELEREREREAGESERKRLRREIDDLRVSNDALQSQSLQREAEIRAEVGQEMMKRSMHLLSQIQELRTKLSKYETQAIDDVTKSVRKVHRQQLQVAQEEAVSDLQEAEDEMRRIKAEHDIEVFKLQSENKRLVDELAAVKQQLAASQIELGPSRLKKMASPKRLPSVDQENNPAAFEFSPKFVREKSQNTVSFAEVNKAVAGSPTRSPLSQLSSNQLSLSSSPARSTSPIKTTHASGAAAAAFQFNKSPINLHALAEVTRTVSAQPPIAVSEAVDPSVPYFKKLRSHFTRA